MGIGCINALKLNGFSVTGKKIVLIGGGGAGSAIADAIGEHRAAQLSLVEIDKLKSDTLLLKLQKQYPALTLENNISRPEEIDIVINASPSGMNKNDLLPIDPYTFRSGIVIADSVTKPNFTPFLKSAKSNGCFIQKGSEMADAQLPIFLDFLGTPPENSHV